jgi:hypothetical protein
MSLERRNISVSFLTIREKSQVFFRKTINSFAAEGEKRSAHGTRGTGFQENKTQVGYTVE